MATENDEEILISTSPEDGNTGSFSTSLEIGQWRLRDKRSFFTLLREAKSEEGLEL